MDFTDKVMMKIAAEMVLRERRRARWFTALYIFIGVASAALIAVLFDVFDIITFETWGSIFKSILPESTPTLNIQPDISTIEKAASAVGAFFDTIFSFVYSHSIAAIITANAIILTIAAKIFAPKNDAAKAC